MDIIELMQTIRFRLNINTSDFEPLNKELEILALATIEELTIINGLDIDLSSPMIYSFVADYVVFKHSNSDNKIVMPRHLQFRLHNLIIKKITKEVENNDDGSTIS